MRTRQIELATSDNLNWTGGTLDVSDGVNIGGSGTSTIGSSIKLNSGMTLATSNFQKSVQIAAGGTLTVQSASARVSSAWDVIDDGSLVLTAGLVQCNAFYAGVFSGGVGNATISGGEIDANDLILGADSGQGTVAISGGIVRIGGPTSIFSNSKLNLSGGVLSTRSLAVTGSNAQLNWTTGGTLEITNSDFSVGTATTDALGVTRTIGSGMTLRVLQGADAVASHGRFSVNAGGTLNLAGGRVEVRSIAVNGGTFNFTAGNLWLGGDTSTFSSPLVIGSGGNLRGGGTISAASVSSSGHIAPGSLADGTPAPGTLIFSGNLSSNGAIDIASATQLRVSSGTLSVTSGGTLNVSGGTLNARSLAIDAAATLNFTDGTITVDGGSLAFPNAVTQATTISSVAGRPTLVLRGGAFGALTSGSTLTVGSGTGRATLDVRDAGTTLLFSGVNGSLHLGEGHTADVASDGLLTVSGGGSIGGSGADVFIGDGGGHATANVAGVGSTLSAHYLAIGYFSPIDLGVRYVALGTLEVTDGGHATVSADAFIGGDNGGSNGTGTINVGRADGADAGGSLLQVSGGLVLGDNTLGLGTLRQRRGGAVTVGGDLTLSTGSTIERNVSSPLTNDGLRVAGNVVGTSISASPINKQSLGKLNFTTVPASRRPRSARTWTR